MTTVIADFNPQNAYYHSVRYLLPFHLLHKKIKDAKLGFFHLLPKNLKIQNYNFTYYSVHVCETWSLILREDYRLKLTGNKIT
jgi:uncharacterized membrane protein YfhO